MAALVNVEREIVVNIFWKLLKERSESSGIYEYTNIMCKGIKLNTYSFLATAALLIKKEQFLLALLHVEQSQFSLQSSNKFIKEKICRFN